MIYGAPMARRHLTRRNPLAAESYPLLASVPIGAPRLETFY